MSLILPPWVRWLIFVFIGCWLVGTISSQAIAQPGQPAPPDKVKQKQLNEPSGPKIWEVGKGLQIKGNLGKGTASEIFQVQLVQGGTYVIDMLSPNQKELDPFLRLLDAQGKNLAEDDDGGDGLNARIVWVAPATGVYQIVCTSFGFNGLGPYSLEVKRDDNRQAKALLLKKARQMENKAWELFRQWNYPEALILVREVLAIRKKVLGDNHLETAISLNDVGLLLQLQSNYSAARPYFEEALAIRKKTLGDNHPATAFSLNNLGMLVHAQGDFVAARPYLEQALAIRKKVLGDNHPQTAESLNNLSLLLMAEGEYAPARQYLEQALAIHKKIQGDNHPETAKVLLNLGHLLKDQGEYAAARQYYEQVLAIHKKAQGDNHPKTADSLANSLGSLGLLLYAQADYDAARPYLEQALAIHKKVHGDYHQDTAIALNNLALLLVRQKEYTVARQYYEQALANHKKVLGDNHLKTAGVLHNLGGLSLDQKDYVAARKYHEQALVIYQKVLGDNHLETATTHIQLGLVLKRQGDYAASRQHYEKALAIYKKVHGDYHPDTALALNNLGCLFQAQGDFDTALPYCEKALVLSRHILDLAATGQSERQQLIMGEELRHRLDWYLSLPCDGESVAGKAFNHILAWKGSIFLRQQQLRLERSDPKIAFLLTDLRSTSGQLAALAFAKSDPKNREFRKKQLTELSERKEMLERELTQKSQVFSHEQEIKNLAPAQLLELLPAGTVLVDFLVYRHEQADPKKKDLWFSEQRLTAFILHPGSPITRLDLGPIQPIEKAIHRWRILTKKHGGDDHPGGELRRLLWQPLEKYLVGAKTILIAPDGVLGQFPFGALPGSRPGSYLLEEVAISVVPVPRLLAAFLGKERKQQVSPSLLLVGGVDFDALPGQGDVASRLALTGERSGSIKTWQHLPGTQDEIVSIQGSFKKSFPVGQVKLLQDKQATESILRELLPKYSILHLATHGFFAIPETFSPAGQDRIDQPNGSLDSELFGSHGVTVYHPGLLSGLVVAGANHPPETGQDDGILTALEVAELDLSKVNLAVLSACETGLGKSAGGEGVLGLQRAFQVAGTRSVIASLWQVPDRPTQVLMSRFYDNFWVKKLSKAEALREAQLWMLREGRQQPGLLRGLTLVDEPTITDSRLPPFFWAAFVLSGDWR